MKDTLVETIFENDFTIELTISILNKKTRCSFSNKASINKLKMNVTLKFLKIISQKRLRLWRTKSIITGQNYLHEKFFLNLLVICRICQVCCFITAQQH